MNEGEAESPKDKCSGSEITGSPPPLFNYPLSECGVTTQPGKWFYKFRCTKVVIFPGLIDPNSQRLLRQFVKFSRLSFSLHPHRH
jgi:hypothetical protein